LVAVSENNLFAQWADDDRAQISVENLLHMSSGLDFDEVYAPGSDATRMLFMDTVASDVPLQSALAQAPGSHFYYSSGTTNLLTLLFNERVGGPQNALNHLYQDILWPLGMRHTTLEPDASGVFVGSSNIYASARDWARLGQVFLRQGALNGVQIADESYMQAAIQPNSSNNSPAYGYQVWLNRGGNKLRWPDLPADAFAFTGNRGQVVMMIPSLDAVLVRMGWSARYYPRNERFAAWLRNARDG
jgi:CubicO group peptidase (beta-lactamase class C family)